MTVYSDVSSFLLSNSKYLKAENKRNSEETRKEMAQKISKILSTKEEMSQLMKLSNLWLTLCLLLSSNLKFYEKPVIDSIDSIYFFN